jgi:hypothetical protein
VRERGPIERVRARLHRPRVEKLIEAARKHGRYGHRDATQEGGAKTVALLPFPSDQGNALSLRSRASGWAHAEEPEVSRRDLFSRWCGAPRLSAPVQFPRWLCLAVALFAAENVPEHAIEGPHSDAHWGRQVTL